MRMQWVLRLLTATSLVSLCAPTFAQERIAAAKDQRAPKTEATLKEIVAFPEQQITGIAVSKDGRIFVNLPRWTLDVPVSVGEVKDGYITPFPDSSWNAYRNSAGASNKPKEQFVCVQSVVFDHEGFLWALDPASPGQQGPIKDGPKLVKIDIHGGKVVAVVAFDETVAPPGSYLNDVRFSPDDHFAYITDSGIKGAIVVVDLHTKQARRILDGDPATQFEKSVEVNVDGAPLRRPDGRAPQFAADGVALSPDGATLYWQALTGKTLYSLPTAAAQDPAQSVKPTTVATTHPADGLWIDAAGHFFITNPEQNSVEVADKPGEGLRTLVKDDRLRWPDSFGQGADGTLFVTASHIQDSPWFRPEAKATPSAIFRIDAHLGE